MAVAGTDGFLGELAEPDRRALLDVSSRRRFRRGASMTVEGESGQSVFIVVDGRVKVLVDTAEGDEVVLAVLGRGEVVGEFEAVDPGSSRTATNVAIDDVECRSISGAEFRRFLEEHPQAMLVLLRRLIGRLRAADRRRIDSASTDVTHRLARYLLELAEEGTEIPLTQGEVSGLIAASRESVVRAVTALRARGLVTSGRRRLAVCDLERLRRFADSPVG